MCAKKQIDNQIVRTCPLRPLNYRKLWMPKVVGRETYSRCRARFMRGSTAFSPGAGGRPFSCGCKKPSILMWMQNAAACAHASSFALDCLEMILRVGLRSLSKSRALRVAQRNSSVDSEKKSGCRRQKKLAMANKKSMCSWLSGYSFLYFLVFVTPVSTSWSESLVTRPALHP